MSAMNAKNLLDLSHTLRALVFLSAGYDETLFFMNKDLRATKQALTSATKKSKAHGTEYYLTSGRLFSRGSNEYLTTGHADEEEEEVSSMGRVALPRVTSIHHTASHAVLAVTGRGLYYWGCIGESFDYLCCVDKPTAMHITGDVTEVDTRFDEMVLVRTDEGWHTLRFVEDKPPKNEEEGCDDMADESDTESVDIADMSYETLQREAEEGMFADEEPAAEGLDGHLTATLLNHSGVISTWYGRHGSLFGVTEDGDLLAFGENDYGQLGLPDREFIPDPTPVDLPIGFIVDKVIVGANSFQNHWAVFIFSGTRCLVAGRNDLGSLGVGGGEVTAPVEIPIPVDAVITNGDTNIFNSSGQLMATGLNNHGMIVPARTAETWTLSVPTPIVLPESTRKVVLGDGCLFVQKKSKKWLGRGSNVGGRLGVDETDETIEEWIAVVDRSVVPTDVERAMIL